MTRPTDAVRVRKALRRSGFSVSDSVHTLDDGTRVLPVCFDHPAVFSDCQTTDDVLSEAVLRELFERLGQIFGSHGVPKMVA